MAGPDDSRLGNIDAVLLSHVNSDHLGDRHIEAPKSGACDGLGFPVVAAPNSNSVNIVMAKNARFCPPFMRKAGQNLLRVGNRVFS